MARKSKVNYWDTRGGYYCWHKGKQVLLAKGPKDEPNGPTYLAAVAEFGRLHREDSGSLFFGELVGKYLEWMKHHRKPKTADCRERSLSQAKDDFGHRYVSSLTTYELEEWAVKQRRERGWADGTVNLVLSAVRACLRWAAEKGVIPSNPVGKLELPASPSRSNECVLSPEQKRRVVEAARGPTRELVVFLRDTGCRPGEARAVEARHYDRQIQALVLPAVARPGEATHKRARTGKPRTIYLSGEALALVEELCKRYPTGPLFRCRLRVKGERGHKGERSRWTDNGIVSAIKYIRQRVGIPGLIAYSFRHTFAVEWLRQGRSSDELAEILGTSRAMIERHYGHLADQKDHLRSRFKDFHSARVGQAPLAGSA